MSSRGIPPFLKKLVQVTENCPPSVGAWNAEGTQFVVTSSQFADVLREHFACSLQTFVRQLHFYSFQKKDDGSTGVWTFSHPSFRRGQIELLSQIERKANPKKKPSKKESEPSSASTFSTDSANKSILDRIAFLEARAKAPPVQDSVLLNRISMLEAQVHKMKEELEEYRTAKSILSLDPSNSEKVSKATNNNNSSTLVSWESRPAKYARLTSNRSVESLIAEDFPFEDNASVGSLVMKDLVRELQTDIFADFEEFLPVPSTPVNTTTDSTQCSSGSSETCEKELHIPQNFELQPGVTISLLKGVFDFMAKMCCPKSNELPIGEHLRNMCTSMPAPNTLPPVEICPVSLELLPTLRENVKEKATDLALMRAARQVYEIYHQNMTKKLNEKIEKEQRASAQKLPSS